MLSIQSSRHNARRLTAVFHYTCDACGAQEVALSELCLDRFQNKPALCQPPVPPHWVEADDRHYCHRHQVRVRVRVQAQTEPVLPLDGCVHNVNVTETGPPTDLPPLPALL